MDNEFSLFTISYLVTENNNHVGFVDQVPGIWSEGNTLDELKENLLGALKAMFVSNKIDAEITFPGFDKKAKL